MDVKSTIERLGPTVDSLHESQWHVCEEYAQLADNQADIPQGICQSVPSHDLVCTYIASHLLAQISLLGVPAADRNQMKPVWGSAKIKT